MLSNLKRYSMALLFLSLVVLFMLLGTLAVKDFGEKMFEETNITMQPKGTKLTISSLKQ